MSGQRTFWHLAALGHKPRDYDIASTELLYYRDRTAVGERGFAVNTPVAQWYREHQRECALHCDDWDEFRDPRETTYTRYTELQRDKEIYVDGLLAAADVQLDARLPAAWVGLLDRVLGPLRFPVHGLQMVASYVGSMAPGGRIVIACLFQAADELRRVQRLAQRTRQLQYAHPALAAHARTQWQDDPAWQPLRELIERLLVVYRWDEALVALDGAIKPAFDALLGTRLAALAHHHGDELLTRMLGSLAQDAAWHREWSAALFELLGREADNASCIDGWLGYWGERAQLALAPIARLLDAPGSSEP